MKTAIQTDLKALLNLVIEKEKADKGTLQKYHSGKKVLEVIEAEGFSKEFLEHFKVVKQLNNYLI